MKPEELNDLKEAKAILDGKATVIPEIRHIRAYKEAFDDLITFIARDRKLTFSLNASTKVEIDIIGGPITPALLDRLILYLQIMRDGVEAPAVEENALAGIGAIRTPKP